MLEVTVYVPALGMHWLNFSPLIPGKIKQNIPNTVHSSNIWSLCGVVSSVYWLVVAPFRVFPSTSVFGFFGGKSNNTLSCWSRHLAHWPGRTALPYNQPIMETKITLCHSAAIVTSEDAIQYPSWDDSPHSANTIENESTNCLLQLLPRACSQRYPCVLILKAYVWGEEKAVLMVWPPSSFRTTNLELTVAVP